MLLFIREKVLELVDDIVEDRSGFWVLFRCIVYLYSLMKLLIRAHLIVLLSFQSSAIIINPPDPF